MEEKQIPQDQDWFNQNIEQPFPTDSKIDMTTDLNEPNQDVSAFLTSSLTTTFAKTMFQSASKNASNWFTFEFLKPYFNVTEREVIERCVATMKPYPIQSILTSPDLYGPLMNVLTLALILVMHMKSMNVIIVRSTKLTNLLKKQQGTILGTAVFICLVYWFGISIICFVMGLIIDCDVGIIQALSLFGYQAFPICILSLISYFLPKYLFYLCFIVIGGLSAISLGRTLKSKSSNTTKGFIIFGVMASLHLLFIFYLYYFYGYTN